MILEHFAQGRPYHGGYVELETAEVSAFLTFPITFASLKSQKDYRKSRIIMEQELPAEHSENPSDVAKLIQDAINALRLNVRL